MAKTRSQRMDQASRRKIALQENLVWRKAPSVIPDKKKARNKKKCRVKISPTKE